MASSVEYEQLDPGLITLAKECKIAAQDLSSLISEEEEWARALFMAQVQIDLRLMAVVRELESPEEPPLFQMPGLQPVEIPDE